MSAADRQADAVAALRRIAFLLERAQASPYRSEAFRAAARSVEREAPDRVGALVRAGALTDLPAVGARTAEVVALVVRGEPVEYLETLEAEHAERSAREVDPAAVALRERLRGDLHAHTEASDGATPVQEMVLAAMELGHEYLAITDHSPRLTVANGLSAPRLRAQMDQVAALNRAVGPFVVLTGIECDVLDDGGLDQDPDLLDALDVVVASVHSKLRMDSRAMTARMVAAVSNPRTDVLGHCTGRRLTGRARPQSEFDARAVFEACAEHGVAVEVNCRPDRLDPPHDLLALAVEVGCDLSIDTDAHAPGQLDWLLTGCERVVQHGVDADRVITTWPVERLRERTHG
ncbi:PHP domain-containing protein [Cellulomonas biazotea]|uniref:PHP domain-containing protein n=1 Tax=Cellulomonas biazotea TaxID=1709 RepID=A0A402DLU7_9CELL|nr:PHP domain-containing protein [Cellulomonas biazotea]GCE75104.1 PHP domain-containing protein [Cellulomonas biazotea]